MISLSWASQKKPPQRKQTELAVSSRVVVAALVRVQWGQRRRRTSHLWWPWVRIGPRRDPPPRYSRTTEEEKQWRLLSRWTSRRRLLHLSGKRMRTLVEVRAAACPLGEREGVWYYIILMCLFMWCPHSLCYYSQWYCWCGKRLLLT